MLKQKYNPETGEIIEKKRTRRPGKKYWAGVRAWPWKTKLLAFAAALRIYQIAGAALWYDEGVTAVFSRLPWARMIEATAGDVHPPGYYIITWLISAAGIPINELTARIPSALLSIIAVYLTGLLVEKMELNDRGQFIVMAWVSISPLQLHYAQEARMYSLLQALVLLSIYLILERRRLFLAITLTAILYTHNYGVFYLPALGLATIMYLYDREKYIMTYKHLIDHFIYKWAAWFILPVILFIPWLIILLGQMSTISAGYWIQPVTVPSIIFVFYQLLFAYSMPPTFQGLGVLLTCGLLIYTAWRIHKDRPSYWQFLTVIVLTPFTLAVLMSIVWRPLLLFRGLIGTAIPLTILAVKAIEGIEPVYKKIYAYTIIGITLIAGVAGHYLYNADNKGATITWVHEIENEFQNGDIILSLNDNGIIATLAYAPDLPYYKLENCGAEPLGSLSQATRQALGVTESNPDKLIGEVYNYNPTNKYTRIWFISTVAPISPACEIEAANNLINSDKYRVELFIELANTEYTQAGVYLITSKDIY